MQDICIYVANHKDVAPLDCEPYRVLRVGSHPEGEHHPGISYDSDGESISYKNFAYCELTGLYWIWKNTSHDITGLMHYRRYLMSPDEDRPLSAEEIEAALEEHDCLVAKPERILCSVAEHFCHNHISFDWLVLMDVMAGQPQEYQRAFQQVSGSELIIPCNMMIAKREVFDAYCNWLFSVLAECEKRIDLYSGRDEYQRRVFGFLAERLLAVWLIARGIDCGHYDIQMNGARRQTDGIDLGDYIFDRMAAIRGVSEEQLFDAPFYFDLYDDVAKVYALDDAIDHFVEYGAREERLSSPHYVLEDYANLRPRLRSEFGEMDGRLFASLAKEVKRVGQVPLSRHIILGETQRGLIDYAPVYDWFYYTSRYDDVPNDYHHTEEALEHFVKVGIPEGRQGSKGFALSVYKKEHPSLERFFGNKNFLYYLCYALGEGRKRLPISWRYVG